MEFIPDDRPELGGRVHDKEGQVSERAQDEMLEDNRMRSYQVGGLVQLPHGGDGTFGDIRRHMCISFVLSDSRRRL